MAKQVAHPLEMGKVMGSMLGQNSVITKHFCLLLLCFGPKWAQLITMYAQLGLSNKGRAIKGLVIYYEVWLGSMKGVIRTCARCAGLVRIAIELKSRNTP